VKIVHPLGAALLILTFQGVARAQPLHVPPVEIGGQAGVIGAIGEGVHMRPTVGPRLTVNISPQHAIELAADTLAVDDGPGIYGLYFLQYKRTTRSPPDWSGIRPFFTAGTGGYYAYRKIPEYRVPRQDGSVVVYPAHSSGELSRLSVAAFGGGFEKGLSRYASFRVEGGGFVVFDSGAFIGFRMLTGISIPIGGYRASPVR